MLPVKLRSIESERSVGSWDFPFWARIWPLWVMVGAWQASPVVAQSPRMDLISGDFEGGMIENAEFVNSVVGWDDFFFSGFRGGTTTIGNLEAGHAWFEHEVFVRPEGGGDSFFLYDNPAHGVLGELDYHATTVAHVLAGSGYVENGEYSLLGLGMAPEARVVSGALATDFSATDFGSFSVTADSVVSGYRDFFRGENLGEGVDALDVINSSWGGGDGAAASPEALVIDGLARENPTVALVAAAGNGGAGALPGWPASGFNSISVGSVGGEDFATVSGFSSGALADFFDPVENGGTLHEGVRVAVDLVAPGEKLFLAAYLGDSGTIGATPDLVDIVQDPPPLDQYFIEIGGTSYAAPIVAGGIALLKDVAKAGLGETPDTRPDVFDTRVIKSVLMAGARATEGWDNGQDASGITEMALDPRAGAGVLDLRNAADVYLSGTRGLVSGDGERFVSRVGWDLASVSRGGSVDYVIEGEFALPLSFAASVNWFSQREVNEGGSEGFDTGFADLNLQLWLLDEDGEFVEMAGESRSRYQNTEFLRFELLDAGRYGLRVTFDDVVFETGVGIEEEWFGLAWQAVMIPEPGTVVLVGWVAALVCVRRRWD